MVAARISDVHFHYSNVLFLFLGYLRTGYECMPVTGDGLSFLSSFSFSESIIRWFWRLSHADAQERRSFYSALVHKASLSFVSWHSLRVCLAILNCIRRGLLRVGGLCMSISYFPTLCDIFTRPYFPCLEISL